MHRIFVYGTLRAGYGNHQRLLRKAQGLDLKACTQPGFRMFSAGGFPMVAALPVEQGGGVVQGEVYEVDDATLLALDRLEGHPQWYRRTPVLLGNGMSAETYLMPLERCATYPVVASGDWTAFQPPRTF